MAARKMYGIETNIHGKELCFKLVIYKDYILDLKKNIVGVWYK